MGVFLRSGSYFPSISQRFFLGGKTPGGLGASSGKTSDGHSSELRSTSQEFQAGQSPVAGVGGGSIQAHCDAENRWFLYVFIWFLANDMPCQKYVSKVSSILLRLIVVSDIQSQAANCT